MNYLPTIDLPDHPTRGRNVHDGYQRGWGLQMTDLPQQVLNDPTFIPAANIVLDRMLLRPERYLNLFLLLKFYLSKIPPGDIVEFGSYRGGSAMFMAALCPDRMVYALDTFAGMPATDAAIDLHKQGDFSDVNTAEITRKAKIFGLTNLVLVKGRFEDTIPVLLPTIDKVALAHIDCDIKSAVTYAFHAIRPHMVAGGYYVFDDATESTCIGATEAVEEIIQAGYHCEQIWPHFVFREKLAVI